MYIFSWLETDGEETDPFCDLNQVFALRGIVHLQQNLVQCLIKK